MDLVAAFFQKLLELGAVKGFRSLRSSWAWGQAPAKLLCWGDRVRRVTLRPLRALTATSSAKLHKQGALVLQDLSKVLFLEMLTPMKQANRTYQRNGST